MAFGIPPLRSDPWGSMEQVRSERDRNFENRSRNASAFGFQKTTGYGEFQFEDPIPFDLAFVEEPAVAFGVNVVDVDLVDGRFPRCSGGVYEWQQDAKGFYIGAWVYVCVETLSLQVTPTGAQPNYVLRHSFWFSGLAYKSLPDFIGEDL